MQVSVWRDGVPLAEHTVGRARIAPPETATDRTPYDLASVTKPFAGGLVAAALLADGRLDLDAPVRETLPEIDPRVTARHLLDHSSGLPAWAPLYDAVERAQWGTPAARQAILAAARRTPLVAAPGTTSIYSDLGFLVLCALLEAKGGARIDALLSERVLAPAGVDLRWGWPGAAATEDCPVRGDVVQGEVHDLNAFAMGGVSTHAGLFGTAHEVARLGAKLLAAVGGGGSLPDCRVLWDWRGPGSHRLGWDGVSAGGYTSTGASWPSDGVGHLGYTGTSVWLAPARGVAVAVCTNRVHPFDEKAAIRAARPRIHDAVAADLGWSAG